MCTSADEHHDRQRVDAERPVGGERTGVDPGEDGNGEDLAPAVGDVEEGYPREHGRDDEKPRGDQLRCARSLRRGVVLAVPVMMRFPGVRVRMRRVAAVRAVGFIRLAARMPCGGAEDRDDPRDDRAEKRQEDDRRIQGASPSSC
jgi:hypothetical protein